MKQESYTPNIDNDLSTEISDDIDVVGLGRMLSEARESMGLSQQQVADKLNFRVTLVQDIEAEKFDQNLPAAFNRGYLKNYAKLVNIPQEDVLNSYIQLGVAQKQCAEMQSFSKGTEKQAEHNMVMWITYLILIALATATVVWWYQAPSVQPVTASVTNVNEPAIANNDATDVAENNEVSNDEALGTQADDSLSQAANDNVPTVDSVSSNAQLNNQAIDKGIDTIASNNADVIPAQLMINNSDSQENTEEVNPVVTPTNLVFTFLGDCWVNIYDATGERVAWGVKKSGYIMRFSGQAPFKVTLGKPELVQIEYNDAAVDITGFKAGIVAKFSLPLKS